MLVKNPLKGTYSYPLVAFFSLHEEHFLGRKFLMSAKSPAQINWSCAVADVRG